MSLSSREPWRCRIVVPFLGVLAIGLMGAAEAAATEETAPKETDGYVRLFEGDKENVWLGYGKDTWPEGWELADGVLHRKSSGGDLQTREEYGDFDLRFGWKVAPGGNSGVIYRVSREKGWAFETGPEYQVLDNAKHKDGKSLLTSAGSLYALYAPSKDAARPAGEWNRARIVVQGNRVRHFLNGEKVVDVELGGKDWNQRVAESKFADLPKFGKNKRGHIVLQDHGDEVWYRNMRIKVLDDSTGEQASK